MLASEAVSALEIGPFCNPVLIGENVSYFDVLTRADLIKRANEIGYDIKHAPHIDFVSPNGDLSIVDRKFDAVLSSHCIEHQPDFIRHLNDVANLLNEGGAYFLIIPDKRYCFDAGIEVSSIAEVVAAHIEGRKVHSLTSAIEHFALTTHNDPPRHWEGNSFDDTYENAVLSRIKLAVQAWEGGKGGYIDVHAWQFTPTTFREMITRLCKLNYIGLVAEEVHETALGSNEFTAILRKPKQHSVITA
ncbi:class I SAM-dependent methyltransferase [Brucella haematophila]|uniref:Class I SAM-dependent methyltransferase n=2 Tax=Brucella haematophila TaxID=419474 RepID=A0ABX1DNT7_9HYPH|nr:class I SAM-dependent methyltransferase [Brucella haematophila]TMV01735.1 class I SAM-dependent methyltransferase [Brucella haematophila]